MDSAAVLSLLQQVADDVIRPRFRTLGEHELMENNPGDLVTVADREAETVITRALRAAYPDAVVLGEEAHALTPRIADAWRVAPHSFTVDPVDGTKNFVHGSPDYAVMVAELREGLVVRSWIWQPEHEVAWVAERGAGTTRNGERVRTRPPADPDRPQGGVSRRGLRGHRIGVLPPLRGTWLCCGLDYPHLIEGDLDFLLYRATKPWDHAPGALLLAEAGGCTVTWPDGGPYAPAEAQPGGILAAADPDVAGTVRRVAHGDPALDWS